MGVGGKKDPQRQHKFKGRFWRANYESLIFDLVICF